MRKIDEDKHSLTGMATKTINFEKIVLQNLERRAKNAGTSVSKLVNLMCRRIALSDKAYLQLMAKHHAMKLHEYRYHLDNCENMDDPVAIELELKNVGKLTT